SSAAGVVPAVLHALADSWNSFRAGTRGDLQRGGETMTGFVALLLVLLLAMIESWANPRISFSLFFLLVVTYAAWFGGRKAGVVVAFASSLALFLNEARGSDDPTPRWPLYWNLWMQIGIYLFAAFLVSALRSLKQNLALRAHERTEALEREVADRRQ